MADDEARLRAQMEERGLLILSLERRFRTDEAGLAEALERAEREVSRLEGAASRQAQIVVERRALAEKIGEDKLQEREAKVRRVYPMRRIGEPEDVSHTVLFLCSDLARHITGQILSVNGGYAMPG